MILKRIRLLYEKKIDFEETKIILYKKTDYIKVRNCSMFHMGMPELILVLVIVLIVFGPKKLPEIGKSLGKSLKEFKQETNSEKKVEDTAALAETKKEEKQEDSEK